MSEPPTTSTDNRFYARGDIAERYERARALPADVERQWANLLAKHVGSRPSTSVDLGCGTGRFTRVLASTFGGRVVGVDPSLPMLRKAAETPGSAPRVHLVIGRAEEVPLAPGCADLVLMSMSYHHVSDKAAALASVRRTLRPGGTLCVRTCSVEALDSYLYQRFFPQARAFDEQRFPTRDGLVREVAGRGFAASAFDTFRQRITDGLRAYRGNVASRAHSDLQAITDEQFAAGMRRLDEWIASQPDRPVYEDVDLFTFTRT